MDIIEQFAYGVSAFNRVINAAFEYIAPMAEALAYTMAVISVMFLGWAILMRHTNIIMKALETSLIVGLIVLLVTNVQDAGETISRGAAELGLRATASSMSADRFINGSDIVFAGFIKFRDLELMAEQACQTSVFGCAGALNLYLPPAITGPFVMFTFLAIAIMVVSAGLMFKVSFLIGVLLLPLLLVPPLAQFGWFPIRVAFHAGVQIMSLAILTGIGTQAFTSLTLAGEPGWPSTLPIAGATFLFLALVLTISKIAMSVTSGAMTAAGSLLGPITGMTTAGAAAGARGLKGPTAQGAKMAKAMAGASFRAAQRPFTPYKE